MSDTIVSDYLRRIGSGELADGDALPTEAALGGEYSVSRGVAREAVRTLAAKGFVLASQGSTTVVAPRRDWNVLDPAFLAVNSGEEYFENLQEAREVIEPLIASIAATRVDAARIERLQQIQAQIEAAGEPTRHAALDVAFHLEIAEATDNPILASMLSLLSGLGYRTRTVSAAVPGAIDRASEWHRSLIAALADGDAALAAETMTGHLRQVRIELAAAGAAATPSPHPAIVQE